MITDKSVDEKETGRIEAFSDGVFAIAITLLILDIKVPRVSELPGGEGLLRALLKQWPTYLAYTTSFLTILVMWVNHHKLFQVIRRTDHWFLILNGLLLMAVTSIPFPTALFAEYMLHREARVAAAVYAGAYLLIAVLFNLLWRYASYQNRLLGKGVSPALVQGISNQYRFGPLLYLVQFTLAFVSAAASFAFGLLLALFFALPLHRH